MADFWNVDWLTRSAMFAPLRPAGARLPAIGWPDPALLNALALEVGRVVNAQGQQIRFVTQQAGPRSFEEGFEQRAFLKGEVQVRPLDWHDLFNALAWMTFPTSKAVINARHFESLSPDQKQRTPVQDALTQFDEDGVLVLSPDSSLLGLVREFRWKDLFRERREEVRARMRFLLFGHALYHKALDPFVGMTGKGILIQVPEAFLDLDLPAQVARADRLLAAQLWDRTQLCRPRELAPVPVLGVPGWWPGNEEPGFYDNTEYFRPGRRPRGDQSSSPSM